MEIVAGARVAPGARSRDEEEPQAKREQEPEGDATGEAMGELASLRAHAGNSSMRLTRRATCIGDHVALPRGVV